MVASLERAFKPFKGTLDNGVAVICGNWAIGATGAVGAKVGATGMTLTRSGVGTYSIQLTGLKGVSARVNAILSCMVNVVTSDADPSNDTAAIDARVLTFVASTGIITFQTFDEAGAVQDPASGAFIMVDCKVRISAAIR